MKLQNGINNIFILYVIKQVMKTRIKIGWRQSKSYTLVNVRGYMRFE